MGRDESSGISWREPHTRIEISGKYYARTFSNALNRNRRNLLPEHSTNKIFQSRPIPHCMQSVEVHPRRTKSYHRSHIIISHDKFNCNVNLRKEQGRNSKNHLIRYWTIRGMYQWRDASAHFLCFLIYYRPFIYLRGRRGTGGMGGDVLRLYGCAAQELPALSCLS